MTLADRLLIKPVSEEEFDEMLCCLPPAEIGNTRPEFEHLTVKPQKYFLVGEANYHDSLGQARYTCYLWAEGEPYKFADDLVLKGARK